MAFGIGGATSVRRSLGQYRLTATYAKETAAGLILALTIYYMVRFPHLLGSADETDTELWLLKVGVPWAICSLGLPLVVPRLWAAVKAGLNDGAVQWMLTAVAAVSSYAVFTGAQWGADYLIQGVVQTRPDQLPGAQRLLTAIFAVYGWTCVFYVVATLALFLVPIVEMRATGKRLVGLTSAFTMLFALFYIPLTAVETIRRAMPSGFNLQESLILSASFMPNRVVEGTLRTGTGEIAQQTRLACRNLAPETYVAFVHPDEVVPDKVLAAEPRSDEIPDGAPAYSYRLAACENSNSPDKVDRN
jgi:hypothetical protein